MVCDVLSAVWQVIFRVLVLNTFHSILDLVREEKKMLHSPPRSRVTVRMNSLGFAKVLVLGLYHLPQVTSCRETGQLLASVPGMNLLSPLASGRLEMQLLSLRSQHIELWEWGGWRLGDTLDNFSRFRI